MKARTWLFLLLLFGLFGAALLLQSRIKNRDVKAAPRISAENRLDLIVGGKAPILQLRSKPQAPRPFRLTSQPPPKPKPSLKIPSTTKRWVTLQKGQTLYGICVEILKDPGSLRQVLNLNGWSEEDAKNLQPGTRVQLPFPTHSKNPSIQQKD